LAALFLAAAAAIGEKPRIAGEVDSKGLTQRIARERGRVVLVNFWATWCVPCREEFPDLSRLQRKYGPRGLQVLGVTTDLASQGNAVEKFLAGQKPAFPNYYKKSGGDDQVFIDAVDTSWGGELPFSILIARDGRKAKAFSGKHTYRQYEQEILKLLN
jgi:thiol-disulfide isomerase/thioredoxin